jgi:rhamnosyltransferase
MSEQKYNIPVCAGIVTFNPQISLLIECISSIYHQVDEILIFDNNSVNLAHIEELSKKYCIKLITSKENVGIAKALNILCSEANSRGYNWILTMDQDSICDLKMVSNLVKYVSAKDAGIIAPRVEFSVNGSLITSTKDFHDNLEEITACITSGSLTNIAAWENIGGFDEWMFIDHVDNEYCIHLRKEGYRNYRVHSAVLHQRAGEMRFLKLPFNKKILLPYYSSLRNYYICRNTVYYLRKYRSNIDFMHELIAFVYAQSIKLIFESNRYKTLISTYKGIRDGLYKQISI